MLRGNNGKEVLALGALNHMYSQLYLLLIFYDAKTAPATFHDFRRGMV